VRQDGRPDSFIPSHPFFFYHIAGRKNWQQKRAVDEFWMIWYSNTGDEYGNAKQKTESNSGL
jgi:hypothetical protein